MNEASIVKLKRSLNTADIAIFRSWLLELDQENIRAFDKLPDSLKTNLIVAANITSGTRSRRFAPSEVTHMLMARLKRRWTYQQVAIEVRKRGYECTPDTIRGIESSPPERRKINPKLVNALEQAFSMRYEQMAVFVQAKPLE